MSQDSQVCRVVWTDGITSYPALDNTRSLSFTGFCGSSQSFAEAIYFRLGLDERFVEGLRYVLYVLVTVLWPNKITNLEKALRNLLNSLSTSR